MKSVFHCAGGMARAPVWFAWRCVFCLALCASAARGLEPTKEEIRKTASEVLDRSHFDVVSRPAVETDFSWILDWIDWLLEPVRALTSGLSTPVTILLYVVLIVTLVLLLGHIIYSFQSAMRGARPLHIASAEVERPDPAEFERRSKALAAEGDYVEASRLLYQAALLRLELQRNGHFRRALTNREYLATFHTEWVIADLKVFATLIDWKWYRDRAFDEEDYGQCAAAYSRLCTRLAEKFGCLTPETQA